MKVIMNTLISGVPTNNSSCEIILDFVVYEFNLLQLLRAVGDTKDLTIINK